MHQSPTTRNKEAVTVSAAESAPKQNQNGNHHNKKRPRRRHRSDSESSSSSSESEHHQPRCNNSNHHHSRNSRHSRRRNHHRQAANKKRQMTLPAKSDFVALDCEMVGIGPGGHQSSVARVTVIDWSGEVLLDEHIQQQEIVTDYRTFVSGVTAEDLESATMTLEECRGQVSLLLESHILVGHALKNDMKALGLSHPWFLTRDTAKYEPFMQVRFDDGVLWPRKLKDLVKEKLHKNIQEPGKPHSPYEDALAALDLYRSVQAKWEKVVQYKVEKTNQIQQQQLAQQQQRLLQVAQ